MYFLTPRPGSVRVQVSRAHTPHLKGGSYRGNVLLSRLEWAVVHFERGRLGDHREAVSSLASLEHGQLGAKLGPWPANSSSPRTGTGRPPRASSCQTHTEPSEPKVQLNRGRMTPPGRLCGSSVTTPLQRSDRMFSDGSSNQTNKKKKPTTNQTNKTKIKVNRNSLIN
ncbi:hypothetical protein IHE44_0006293 [Lamprotornis superbus]|uniref:Uncharacterized protein n=1 Tax=Lamprotornis superbus TaxID=245042 RepID=A0A835P3Y2_9PASS|nr:hypothetical protein IHE44_0006293 [Lamprotornis superbus]